MSTTKVNPPRARSITDIVYVVASYYGVLPSDIMGRSRSKQVAEARSVVYALSRDITRSSFPEIGYALQRDHTTVIQMVRRMSAKCKSDRWLAKALAECRARSLETIGARRVA